MKRIFETKKGIARMAMAAIVAALACGLVACTPQTPSQPADDSKPATSQEAPGTQTEEKDDMKAEAGMYQSDEQCLSCHGGSYEALASQTSDYGLSNPHNSIHGGYNPCVNCHARDKEITDNKCDNCHTWPHNPEVGPGANLQNAPQ